MGDFPDTQAFGRFEGGIFVKFVNVSKEWIFREYLKNLGIWQIPQMFCKCLDILGISQMTGYLRNFPKTQSFGNFPRYPSICEIWGWYILRFWKFFKWMNIWGISQKPIHFDFALYRVEKGKHGTFHLFARQELKLSLLG